MSEIYRRRIPDGPDVIGYHLPGHTVSIGVLVGAGAASDPSGRSGLSHVLSQAVFERSDVPFRLLLEETGLQKDSAANPEWTRYWVRGLADDLPRALPLLAECLLTPMPEDTDIASAKERARGAVLRRREQRELYVSDMLREVLFCGHPLGNRTLGTLAGIENLGTVDIQAFHSLHYRPANMVLGVAGQFDWREVLDLAEASFPASSPASLSREGGQPPPPGLPGARVGELRPTRYQHVGIAFPGPAYGDPAFYTWTVITHLLGWGFSSRLYRIVREQRGLTYSVAARLAACSSAGHVMLHGTTAPEQASDFTAAVHETVRMLAEHGVSPAELAATKVELASQIVLRGESTAARLHTVLTSAWLEPEVRGIEQIEAAIQRVRGTDVEQALSAWRGATASGLATIGPVSVEELYRHVHPVPEPV